MFQEKKGDALVAVNGSGGRVHGWLAVWTWSGTWDGNSIFARSVPSVGILDALAGEWIDGGNDVPAVGKTHSPGGEARLLHPSLPPDAVEIVWYAECREGFRRFQPTAVKSMKTTTSPTRRSRVWKTESGKIGWILLWLIGVPIPVLLVFFLLRGCT